MRTHPYTIAGNLVATAVVLLIWFFYPNSPTDERLEKGVHPDEERQPPLISVAPPPDARAKAQEAASAEVTVRTDPPAGLPASSTASSQEIAAESPLDELDQPDAGDFASAEVEAVPAETVLPPVVLSSNWPALERLAMQTGCQVALYDPAARSITGVLDFTTRSVGTLASVEGFSDRAIELDPGTGWVRSLISQRPGSERPVLLLTPHLEAGLAEAQLAACREACKTSENVYSTTVSVNPDLPQPFVVSQVR